MRAVVIVAAVLLLGGCGMAAFTDHTCDGRFDAECGEP